MLPLERTIFCMQNCLKLIFGLLLCFGGVSCSSSDATAAGAASKSATISDQPITPPTATLVVHGLSCPQCASNVDKQLLAVKGVEQVNVNLGTGQVVVQVSPNQPPTGSQLAAAVKKSGYTLVRIEPGGQMPFETNYFPKTANIQK
jgi:copper chaperone CopZ